LMSGISRIQEKIIDLWDTDTGSHDEKSSHTCPSS
jgi:hypothetical protein